MQLTPFAFIDIHALVRSFQHRPFVFIDIRGSFVQFLKNSLLLLPRITNSLSVTRRADLRGFRWCPSLKTVAAVSDRRARVLKGLRR